MERLLPLKNAVNLRELGEYPAAGGIIAPHKLLRSGSLSQLTAKEAEWLKDYGLKTVIDLRTDNEVVGSPDVVAPGVNWQQLSVYPFADTAANPEFDKHLAAMADRRIDPMAEAYLRMLTDSHAIKVFQQVFALLLANDQPGESVVFHCEAGKDRTGMAAMMIEGALGVPEATIRQDYLLTNTVFFADSEVVAAALKPGASALVDKLNAHAAEAQCYVAVRDFITSEYGDWAQYVQAALRLSDGDLKQLRNLYVTRQ